MVFDRLRKMSRAILGGSLFLLVSSAAPAQPSEPRYVIADQDVSSSADMALSLLLVAPEVRVLGITVVTGDSWRDQEVMHALRLVEGLGQGLGDDVLLDRAGKAVAPDTLRQAQHVVFRARRLGDVDDVAQQGTHAVAAFRAPPRRVGSGRRQARS